MQLAPAWWRNCDHGQGSTDAVLTLVRNWLRALHWICRMASLNHHRGSLSDLIGAWQNVTSQFCPFVLRWLPNQPHLCMTSSTWPTPGIVVIGVDTHKDVHVAVALDWRGGRLGDLRITTTHSGYQELLEWSLLFTSGSQGQLTFGIEGTGSYGAGLSRYLQAAGAMVREVNRPDKTARHRLGKSDEIDADLAARALLSGSATNVPKSGEGVVEMLRMLKSTRDSATEARVKAINQIKAILVTAPESLREQLRELSNPLLVRACSRLQSMEMASPLAAAIRSLRLLGRRCLWLTEEIEQLSLDLDALTLQAAPQLRELHGVGVDAASTLLIAAGDNPERIRSESAFAALCGVNPLPASSGKTNRHRLNRGGNRKANCALWRIVLVRLRWHEATKVYMQRRTLEGKGKREIIRCLKRYVAREIYKVLLMELGMPEAKQAPC